MEEAKNKNPNDESSLLYSILDQLENYRTNDGSFRFRLCYPELNDGCNEWIQKSNPVTQLNIHGYKAVSISFPKTSSGSTFRGLGLDRYKSINLIDDDPEKSGWSNSIGTLIRSSHIPGPSNIKVTKRVLYVRTGKKGL